MYFSFADSMAIERHINQLKEEMAQALAGFSFFPKEDLRIVLLRIFFRKVHEC